MNSGHDQQNSSECREILAASTDYLDRRCTEARAGQIGRHLADCGYCSARVDEMLQQRRAVHALPRRPVPVNLAISLRVIASKQYAQRASRQRWKERLQLWTANTWRPVALPMVGGLVTACLLFAVLLPTLTPPVLASNDAPPSWYQSAELSDLGPFGLRADHITLDLILDEQGRMIDYSIPASEKILFEDLKLRRNVENNLLFMRFKPAEFFGQPTAGKLRITIRRSQLDVKG